MATANTIQRQARNITEKATGTYGFGYNQKNVVGTVNKVCIDNYGCVTVQAFNQLLASKGILDYKFYTTKKHTIHTDEFLTKLINDNSELFPIQF